jgi:hypothetical protein
LIRDHHLLDSLGGRDRGGSSPSGAGAAKTTQHTVDSILHGPISANIL